jgi:hypothetical protein
MLEFIVLGQVPGTRIQLSFSNVLLLWSIAILVYWTTTRKPKHRQTVQTEIRLALIYLTLMLRR